ncbi:MAG: HigA family addiction module antitoxin [Desulfobacterales bacterium]
MGTNQTNNTLHSDLPIPPGEYLEEVIEELGMTKDELAKRMNRPAPKLSAIFKGEKAITPDTALQLEIVVGIPAHIWTGLEAEYRLTLAKKQEEQEQNRLKEETYLVTKFQYAELVKFGVVPKRTRPTEKVLELKKFFGVTSLKTVPNLRRYQVAFRAGKKKRSPEAIAAWLRVGELQALKRPCRSFSRDKLIDALKIIRGMTRQTPDQFISGLHDLLAECGVALVILPHLPQTYANGATFWLGRDKAVMMMTIRYSWADIFWFTLFHEIGHLLKHKRKLVILEGEIDDPEYLNMENEADRFAAEILIPSSEYTAFIKNDQFYKDDINAFATYIGISPGIVVGRLQKEGLIDPSWHNGLRSRFKWRSD